MSEELPPSFWARVLGALLLAAIALPGHRLLDSGNTGVAGDQFLRMGPNYGFNLAVGAVIAAVLGTMVWLAVGTRLPALARRAAQAVERPSTAVAAGGAFLLGTAVTVSVSRLVLAGAPALLDSASQLLQARYLGEGRLAGPVLEPIEFWDFQYMIGTDMGWVSQYPPGHIALLGLGFAMGAVWLVGPILVGLTAAATVLLGEEVFGRRSPLARVAGLLVAVSPFVVGLAASYMNHVTAGLAATVLAWSALRALRGHWGWALVMGTAIGLAVVTRPFFGLVAGVVIPLVAFWSADERPNGGPLAARIGAVIAGGIPWAVGLFAYNAHFFGSPFRFGYTAAQGSAHGLGFHIDPWGAYYGPIEAIGYSAVELRALAVELLQWPLSPLLLVAAYALWVARVPRRLWVVIAWALAPIVANAFYWHHDLVMGPRMLNESAPAWILLVTFCSVGLVRQLGFDADTPARSRLGNWSGVTVIVSLVLGVVLFGPTRISGYGFDARSAGWAAEYPTPPEPALVFVHGSWNARMGARMVAEGLPSDSLRVALEANGACDVQEALDRGRVREDLVFDRARARVTPTATPWGGMFLRGAERTSLSEECSRQLNSDAHGVVGLPQVLWRGDLPGLQVEGALFVRDMGPERNAILVARYADRAPMVLRPPAEGAGWRLVPYDEGMELLWNGDR